MRFGDILTRGVAFDATSNRPATPSFLRKAGTNVAMSTQVSISALTALTTASERSSLSNSGLPTSGVGSATGKLNATMSAAVGIFDTSTPDEFITTMTRWHAGETVTVTPSSSMVISTSLSTVASATSSSVTPIMLASTTSSTASMRASNSTSSLGPTRSLSDSSTTTSQSSDTSSHLSKLSTSSKISSATLSHSRNATSTMDFGPVQPTFDPKDEAKFVIPGHVSCGRREKRLELVAQARMAAARGMNAVVVSYGAQEYVESNDALNDAVEMTLTTISQEAVDAEINPSNDCEGLSFARDLARVHQVAMHRATTWARVHLVDASIHKINDDDDKWLGWLIAMSDPTKSNHRNRVDKRRLKTDFDLLGSGVDKPELENPPKPVDGPKPNPEPVDAPKPDPEPVQPQPPSGPQPTNQPVKPTPNPKNPNPRPKDGGKPKPKPKPKPSDPKNKPKPKPQPKVKPDKPNWTNVDPLRTRISNVIKGLFGGVFGTGPLTVEAIVAPGAYKLNGNLPDGTKVWKGSIYNKADQKLYDIRDYPELRAEHRNPKKFTELINDPQFVQNHRRLMDTPAWQNMRQLFRGTQMQPPDFVNLNRVTVNDFMSISDAADWGLTPPQALPCCEEAGWLKQDIENAKKAYEYHTKMDGVLESQGLPPQAENYFREKYTNIRGDGHMIRQSLKRDFGDPKSDPTIKKNYDKGLLRFQVLDNTGMPRPGAVYLSVRDVQTVSRWGNYWTNPAEGFTNDGGVRVLKDMSNNVILDSYGQPILGQQMSDGSTLMRTTKLIDNHDVLRNMDINDSARPRPRPAQQPRPGEPGPSQPRPNQPRPKPRPDSPRPQPRPNRPPPNRPPPNQAPPNQPRPNQPRPNQAPPNQPRPKEPRPKRPDSPYPNRPRPDRPSPDQIPNPDGTLPNGGTIVDQPPAVPPQPMTGVPNRPSWDLPTTPYVGPPLPPAPPAAPAPGVAWPPHIPRPPVTWPRMPQADFDWGRPRPDTWESGATGSPGIGIRDMNSTNAEAPTPRNGGSSLIAMMDDLGEQIGEIMHFNAQTGEIWPLKNSAIIRKDGKDESCSIAASLNITMPDDACGPPAPKTVCEVHVQVNSFLLRSGNKIDANKFEDHIASSTLCHESVPSSTSSNCEQWETALPANPEPRGPPGVPALMTGCGPMYSSVTTVTDQYCEPPECPTRSPRWVTPLPTIRYSATQLKRSMSCEVNIVSNIARHKGCKQTAHVKSGTFCRQMTEGVPPTTTITFKSFMEDPKAMGAPTLMAMTQAGPLLPRGTLVYDPRDQRCDKAVCPSPVDLPKTPLPTSTWWTGPAKENDFPDFCGWIEHDRWNDVEYGPLPVGVRYDHPELGNQIPKETETTDGPRVTFTK